ncbi:MAG: asparagine synthase (glutamine-hydrolyzing), partial [Gemmatimonadales bacterium]
MSSAIAHRGPDGDGCAVFPASEPRHSTGLAHRRLAIIDLSEGGRQPMTLRCPCCACAGLNDLALTYNGELYNYRELRAELSTRGHSFHTQSDSEVLLHLYGEEGPGMLPRLNGIFALAIRDGRAAGRPEGVQRGDLLLVRDGVGVKPLYYAECAEGLLFASEIKALLRYAGLSRELDLTALHYHLAYLWTPAPRTLLASVRKLPPGVATLVRAGRVARQWSYYDLPYGRPTLPGSEADLAEQLRGLVAAAVERQLVADVEVGAFLSGGLDSSTVVAMMKRARPAERPRCYSIGFRGEGIDGAPADLPYARRVAAGLDLRLETIEVGPSIIDRLDQMLYFLDEPQADPAPINALLIAERAR